MAKLNYIKPMFSICQIPLAAAGSAGGCAQNPDNAQYLCPVTDYETGDVIFQSKRDGCKVTSLYGDDVSICYFVPTADLNIYNS